MQSIGRVKSPYKDTWEIPKELAAKHEAGVLEIFATRPLDAGPLPQFCRAMVN
jgi:hypothetical protein